MAINSTVRDDRTHCFQRGFCFQGCRTGAKWSTLYTELPRAQATGRMELRPQSHVVKIEHDARGKATGVVYYDKDDFFFVVDRLKELIKVRGLQVSPSGR